MGVPKVSASKCCRRKASVQAGVNHIDVLFASPTYIEHAHTTP